MNHKVFYLDGKKINSKQTFLKQAAEAMEFPTYFGANWDAFDKCNIQSFPIVGLNRLELLDRELIPWLLIWRLFVVVVRIRITRILGCTGFD
jgi:hypothetical protein